MVMPVDKESDDYRFYKELNQDIQLVTDEYQIHYDIQFEAGDIVNLTGQDSLVNACLISIMTRFNEIQGIPHYNQFGNKAHQLVKKNKSPLTRKTVESNCEEVLKKIRRIKKINYIEITDTTHGYLVEFSVLSLNDQKIYGNLIIGA